MDSREFREFGKAAVDFVADYIDKIRSYPVLPSVEPGYLRNLLPAEAPSSPEPWTEVLPDIEKFIIPGLSHWQSPRFNAYFPTSNSFPSIVGEILSAGFGTIGFNWLTSPACTELEVITLDWLGKLLGLPDEFLSTSSKGGGVIQGSASESTMVALLVAREVTARRIKKAHPEMDERLIKAKLVGYSSDQSNSSVEKSGILSSIPLRLVKTDDKGQLRGEALREAIEEDINDGLIPCCVITTLGTTGTCAFDRIDEIGPICQEKNIWLHIDAAYAGAAFILPEYRDYLKGVEMADSFNMNPHKWLLVNFDCSALWLKDVAQLISSFSIDREYLERVKDFSYVMPDFRDWQIPLGRRFRALKLWLTLRLYGVSGLQSHIRNHCSLARYFQSLVEGDERFEVVVPATMGLVCFRLKAGNDMNKKVVEKLSEERKIYLLSITIHGRVCLRYVICSRLMEGTDVDFSWSVITSTVNAVLRDAEAEAQSTA